jgi:hypothetical protein
VREVVVDGGVRGRDGLDALGLALVDDASDEFRDVLAQREDAAVANGGVGAEKGCAPPPGVSGGIESGREVWGGEEKDLLK